MCVCAFFAELFNAYLQTVIIGAWDNNIYIYSVDFGRVLETWTCAYVAVFYSGEAHMLSSP